MNKSREQQIELKVRDQIEQKSYDLIADLLYKFNLSKTSHLKNEINKAVEIIAYDENAQIVGGLYGRSIWGTLEIQTLAVKPSHKNSGIGSKLLLAAEKEAEKRNCRFISLNTFSFQAAEFYQKFGFKKIGTETDFPQGFEKYYFRKEL